MFQVKNLKQKFKPDVFSLRYQKSLLNSFLEQAQPTMKRVFCLSRESRQSTHEYRSRQSVKTAEKAELCRILVNKIEIHGNLAKKINLKWVELN